LVAGISISDNSFYRDNNRLFIVGVNWRVVDYDNNFGGYQRVTSFADQIKIELAAIGNLSSDGNVVVRIGLLDSGVNFFDKSRSNFGKINDDAIIFLQWANENNVKIEFTIVDKLLPVRHPEALTDPAIRQNITQNFLGQFLLAVKGDPRAFSALWGFDLFCEPEWCVSKDFGGGWEDVKGNKTAQAISIVDMNAYLTESYSTIKSIAPEKFVTVGISANKSRSLQLEVTNKLDYYSLHHYAWMGPLDSYVSQLPIGKPWLLEEYPSKDEGKSVDPAFYLDYLYGQWNENNSASGGLIWMWQPIAGKIDDHTDVAMTDNLKIWCSNHKLTEAIPTQSPNSIPSATSITDIFTLQNIFTFLAIVGVLMGALLFVFGKRRISLYLQEIDSAKETAYKNLEAANNCEVADNIEQKFADTIDKIKNRAVGNSLIKLDFANAVISRANDAEKKVLEMSKKKKEQITAKKEAQ